MEHPDFATEQDAIDNCRREIVDCIELGRDGIAGRVAAGIPIYDLQPIVSAIIAQSDRHDTAIERLLRQAVMEAVDVEARVNARRIMRERESRMV